LSRDQFSIRSIDITREGTDQVPNQFIQQKGGSSKLALLFPGMGYTCDRPLLYYTTEVLLARDFDVLQLWSNYQAPEFDQLSQSERTVQLITDGQALLSAGRQQGTYTQLLLCGKSLGTLTMAFLLNQDQELRSAATIWFTPLVHLPPVAQAIQVQEAPCFVAGSQADATFPVESTEQIRSNPNARFFITQAADHSLEIPGDARQSIEILGQIMAELITLIS
jgi:hypothetical protein